MSNLAPPETDVDYPESDGLPMADDTLQYDWIVLIVGELRDLFAEQEVFVAGNLFWYPVKGDLNLVSAPDCMVAFGRSPGYRGSYRQWEEGGLAPQVVFEVYSPTNTALNYKKRLSFFQKHGVEEYYFIDPYEETVTGYRRNGKRLVTLPNMNGFVSPRLGVMFDWQECKLVLVGPDGRVFRTREERVAELKAEFELEHDLAETLAKELRAEKRRAAAEQKKTEAEKQKVEALRAKLRALGIDPDE